MIPIKISSNEAIELQLEPWLNILLLQPSETALLEEPSQDALQGTVIEYDNRGCLLLCVVGDATLSKSIIGRLNLDEGASRFIQFC